MSQDTRAMHEGRASEPAPSSDRLPDLEQAYARLEELTERLKQLSPVGTEPGDTPENDEPTIASIVLRKNEAWQAGRVQSLYLRRLRGRLRGHHQ